MEVCSCINFACNWHTLHLFDPPGKLSFIWKRSAKHAWSLVSSWHNRTPGVVVLFSQRFQLFDPFPAYVLTPSQYGHPLFTKVSVCHFVYFTIMCLLPEWANELLKQFQAVFNECSASHKKYTSASSLKGIFVLSEIEPFEFCSFTWRNRKNFLFSFVPSLVRETTCTSKSSKPCTSSQTLGKISYPAYKKAMI